MGHTVSQTFESPPSPGIRQGHVDLTHEYSGLGHNRNFESLLLRQVRCRCGAVQLPGSLKPSARAVPRCMENEDSMDILLAAAQASPVSRFLRKCGSLLCCRVKSMIITPQG